MAKKLVTVCWTITVAVDVPEGISNEDLLNADWQSSPDVQAIAFKAAQDASFSLDAKDGDITDVQDTGDEDEPLTPDEEAELKEIVHKQNQFV